ncbi:MAG: hypothetical protein GVX90_06015 [Alphaproteobacteria bacterium]|nr:hypothetical protein [Alphaproteobacteria bacterium]
MVDAEDSTSAEDADPTGAAADENGDEAPSDARGSSRGFGAPDASPENAGGDAGEESAGEPHRDATAFILTEALRVQTESADPKEPDGEHAAPSPDDRDESGERAAHGEGVASAGQPSGAESSEGRDDRERGDVGAGEAEHVHAQQGVPNGDSASARDRAEGEEAPRQGFGFGISRRDDPIRHVPLSEIRREQSGAPRSADAGPDDESERSDAAPSTSAFTSADGVGEGADPPAPTEGFDVSAPEGETPDTDPEHTRTPIISPDFARRFAFTEAGQDDDRPASGGDDDASQLSETDDEEAGSPSVAFRHGAMPDTRSADEEGPLSDAAEMPGVPSAPHEPAEVDQPEPRTEVSGQGQFEEEHEVAQAADPAGIDDADPSQESSLHATSHDGQGSTAVASAGSARRSHDDETRDFASVDRLNLFQDGEQGLDEEALRALVVDIVHGELQGALGERVSRNIRRLVQREIVKALEARDLD